MGGAESTGRGVERRGCGVRDARTTSTTTKVDVRDSWCDGRQEACQALARSARCQEVAAVRSLHALRKKLK